MRNVRVRVRIYVYVCICVCVYVSLRRTSEPVGGEDLDCVIETGKRADIPPDIDVSAMGVGGRGDVYA